MKIIILGCNGLLGTALVSEFKLGHEVVGMDRSEIDITDDKALREKIIQIKPDIIINSAAYNAVDNIEMSKETYWSAVAVNTTAVEDIARASAELGIPTVHYSTEYVFKGDNKKGYAEDAPVSPVNKYGETKALGEKALVKNNKKYYLIRLSRLFGQAGTAAGKQSFVEIMLSQAGKKEIEVVNDERSCPTYSADLARQTRAIIENKMPFGIYHAANSGACTWYEFAKEIFKIKNVDIKVKPVAGSRFPRSAPRPHFAELLNTKLPAQRSWREALAEFLIK